MIHPTQAQINLEFLRHNLLVVRSLISRDVKLMAVVKSNGYGHGIRFIAKEVLACGADYLAVARVEEGIEIRNSGIESPVLIFEVVARGQFREALEKRLEFTVTAVSGAAELNREAAALGTRARVHVKVDTGMGRLGLDPSRAADEIEQINQMENLETASVWSHFATADSADESYARLQLESFKRILSDLETRGVRVPIRHMANSAAIARFPESHFDMVRPGIMMYGLMPSRELEERLPLKPVMSLLSRVSFIKKVGPGIGISYGRNFITKKATRIATIPIGYADGYPRELSSRGKVLIGGRRYPVVGTVSMDHIMVDVGPDDVVRENDVVTLIGTDNPESVSVRDLAEIRGTIPYEIMCGISARVPRVAVTSQIQEKSKGDVQPKLP